MSVQRVLSIMLISTVAACGGGGHLSAEAATEYSNQSPRLVRSGEGKTSPAPGLINVLSARVSSEPASSLLGIHSLWWEMTPPYVVNAAPHPVVAQLLSAAGGHVRYGGSANEADWSICGSIPETRDRIVVASWSGALRCDFGWQEYLSLTKASGLSSAWLIANVVGDANGEYGEPTLRTKVAEAASRLRQLAPSTQRTWELGNELERGRVAWSPEKISSRLRTAAGAIRKADPSARLVFPLTEFDPPGWTRRNFNDALLRDLGGAFTEFAVHQYYDGAKGGPAVRTQLMILREVASSIERQVGSHAGLWITEHGRWPDGMPDDLNWKSQWWRTNSFSGARSTADYLIGLSQMPSVRGAMLHGLRAGPWNAVQMGSTGPKLSGTGVVLQTLGQSGARWRAKTLTSGTGLPSGWDTYQARVAAFETDVVGEYVLWGVNVSNAPFEATLRFDDRVRAVSVLDSTTIACGGLTAECASDRVITIPKTSSDGDGPISAPVIQFPAHSIWTLRIRAH